MTTLTHSEIRPIGGKELESLKNRLEKVVERQGKSEDPIVRPLRWYADQLSVRRCDVRRALSALACEKRLAIWTVEDAEGISRIAVSPARKRTGHKAHFEKRRR